MRQSQCESDAVSAAGKKNRTDGTRPSGYSRYGNGAGEQGVTPRPFIGGRTPLTFGKAASQTALPTRTEREKSELLLVPEQLHMPFDQGAGHVDALGTPAEAAVQAFFLGDFVRDLGAAAEQNDLFAHALFPA